FRHAAKVLDPDLLDAAGILVLRDFAPTPTFLDGARNRRVHRDGVALDVGHHAIPVDVERLPAALRAVSVHADGGDPVGVADSPDDHGVTRLEAACRGHVEFARAHWYVPVGDDLLRLVFHRD